MRKKWVSLMTILALFTLIAGCSLKQGKSDLNEQPEPPTLTLAFEKGRIVSMDSSRQSWLITQYHEEGSSPYIRAIWLKVSDNTELLSQDQQPLKVEDFQLGQLVKVWNTGPVAESYPEQGAAGKISKLQEDEQAPEGLIQQQRAIQLALESKQAQSFWAIKKVNLHTEPSSWSIEGIDGNDMDSLSTWSIDANTGEVLPQIVAENEAFRLYTPLEEAQVKGSFTAKGQARVFEAMFSWSLEDGHNILAKGNVMADKGAPEWGDFEFEVSYSGASNPTLMLILYVNSAKDGNPEHQLIIPLKHQLE